MTQTNKVVTSIVIAGDLRDWLRDYGYNQSPKKSMSILIESLVRDFKDKE